MAKRSATTQMTHDNWDQEEEEPEKPGEFAAASSDELAQRKIRVAKRRFVGQDSTKSAGSSIFGSFAGFGAKSPTATPPAPIAAASTLRIPTTPAAAFGLPTLSTTSNPPTISLFSSSSVSAPMASKLPDFLVQPPMAAPTNDSMKASMATEPSTDFYAELQSLNESVIKWMQDNFQENPHVDFSPVFLDYKQHFKELEEKHKCKAIPRTGNDTVDNGKESVPARSTSTNVINANGAPSILATSKASSFPVPEPQQQAASQPFKFGLANAPPSTTTTATAPTPAPVTTVSQQTPKPFSFGISSSTASVSSSAASGAPSFSFGSAGGSTTSSFSFGFKPAEQGAGSGDKDAADGGDAGDEDEEYKPPEPEHSKIVENDAFYSVRCKLFFKKDTKYVEKGVGILFLKPLDGGKTQLLIRADTATGTILLNISLNDSMPCSRSGKNNVTLVCVPYPPLDPKSPSDDPAVLLMRVKTGEEADQLLQEINKAKSN